MIVIRNNTESVENKLIRPALLLERTFHEIKCECKI